MSNKLILYSTPLSPCVRMVKIVSRLIGVELEIRDLDFFKEEHMQEWFLKLNPEHTVPTLVDDGFAIWDSHAIATYLIDKYSKDDKMYPKDLQTRARVNQRLFFESSLFVRMRDCSMHVWTQDTDIPEEKLEAVHSSYKMLETFLATDPFLVDNGLTVADIAVACTVTALSIFAPAEPDKYPKITAWLERIMQTVKFFDEMNTKFVEEYRQLIKTEKSKFKK